MSIADLELPQLPVTNALRNDNKLKLGLFALNGTGSAFTNHPKAFRPEWDSIKRVATLADRLGLELLLSFARWRPLGGDGNLTGRTLDVASWAGAIAAITKQISIVSTMHVSTWHPLTVAKVGATIDIISNGRWGLNIVCGWYKAEIEMFGDGFKGHEDRYGTGDEWIEIIERLWKETKSFDYHGKFYDLHGLISDPHPLQKRPVIINAGGSPRGQEFAAEHADIAFVLAYDPRPEAIKKQVDAYRTLAREKYGREIDIWVHSYVAQRDTMEEAHAHIAEYAGPEYGNLAAADAFIENNIETAKMVPPEILKKMQYSFMAGSGIPLLGNAQDIAQTLINLSDAGVDGVLVNWLEYEKGLTEFGQTVIPLLEQAGLRKPYSPS